jgi:hypothetical protein
MLERNSHEPAPDESMQPSAHQQLIDVGIDPDLLSEQPSPIAPSITVPTTVSHGAIRLQTL